jgi:hypothetical protein
MNILLKRNAALYMECLRIFCSSIVQTLSLMLWLFLAVYLLPFEEGNVENGGVEVDKLKHEHLESESILPLRQGTVLF